MSYYGYFYSAARVNEAATKDFRDNSIIQKGKRAKGTSKGFFVA